MAGLLAHIHQFASVFTHNARKEAARPPVDLVDDWRTAIPDQLDELARAWAEESAWQGRVSAGGVDMDAPDNAVVAIEEHTVHGWDLTSATGQELCVDEDRLDRVDQFFALFGDLSAEGEGPFGPLETASQGASRFERTLARTGCAPV